MRLCTSMGVASWHVIHSSIRTIRGSGLSGWIHLSLVLITGLRPRILTLMQLTTAIKRMSGYQRRLKSALASTLSKLSSRETLQVVTYRSLLLNLRSLEASENQMLFWRRTPYSRVI